MKGKYFIPTDHHVFIPGQNGSGKTFLAQVYLAGYPYVVALDTKGMLDWPQLGYVWPKGQADPGPPKDGPLALVDRLDLLPEVAQKYQKIIYRPRWEELNAEYFDKFFKWCYLRRNTVVWIDEVYGVAPSPARMPEYYKAILTRGRQLNVAAWSLTQRPKDIPQVIMSESKHIFCFRLNLPQDRERIVDITGYQEFWQKPGKYEFWYFNTDGDKKPILAKLVKK